MFQPAFIPFNDQYESLGSNSLVPFSIEMIRPQPIKLVVYTHSYLTLFNEEIYQACEVQGVEVVMIHSDQFDATSEHYRDLYDDHIYPSLYLELSSGDVICRKGILAQAKIEQFLNSGE